MSLGFSGFGATCETWNVARQSHLGDRAFLCLTLLLHTMCLWQPGLGWNGLLTGPGLVWVEVPAVLLCVITALPEAAQLEWLWSLAVAHSCLCPWLCRVSVSPLRAQVCVGTSHGHLHSSTGTGGCVRAGPGGVAALLTASAKPSPVLPAQLGERRNLFELGIRNLLNQQHDLGLRAV